MRDPLPDLEEKQESGQEERERTSFQAVKEGCVKALRQLPDSFVLESRELGGWGYR